MNTEQERAELLPCPFCGESKNLTVQHCEGTIIHPAYRIYCDNCGGSNGYTDRGDHVENWNRRAALQSQPLTVDALAQEIRRVNGNNALGAGALAEALMPFLESALQSQDREDALVQAIQEAIALLGPEAPSCSGCEYEWNHALRVLHEAIDHARRVEGE